MKWKETRGTKSWWNFSYVRQYVFDKLINDQLTVKLNIGYWDIADYGDMMLIYANDCYRRFLFTWLNKRQSTIFIYKIPNELSQKTKKLGKERWTRTSFCTFMTSVFQCERMIHFVASYRIILFTTSCKLWREESPIGQPRSWWCSFEFPWLIMESTNHSKPKPVGKQILENFLKEFPSVGIQHVKKWYDKCMQIPIWLVDFHNTCSQVTKRC